MTVERYVSRSGVSAFLAYLVEQLGVDVSVITTRQRATRLVAVMATANIPDRSAQADPLC